MAKLILITGGVRSGKSGFALSMAEPIPSRKIFIATCPATVELADPEMAERILRHRCERQHNGWNTLEETTDLAGAVNNCHQYDVVLIDCLTLWLNNLLFDNAAVSEKEISGKTQLLLAACRNHPGTIIMVTNEVGYGIVPANDLARLYRDLIGRMNQTIGQGADEVVLLVCGQPLWVKKDPMEQSNDDPRTITEKYNESAFPHY